ncbi:MAG: Gfo/Idh/MocA family oxidoreductase, partial [Solirubrobacteraceae bacterium]
MDAEQRPLRVGIAGSGNIGTDLMLKIDRTPGLDLCGVAGIDPASDGLARAAALGHWTTSDGLADMLAEVEDLNLVFDATSAKAHAEHARMLAERGIRSVDLTPAAIGPAVIPPVNLSQHLGAPDVNLV